MSDEVKKARKLLAEGGYTCVAVKNGSTCFSTERGVRPLLEWLEQPEAPLREAALCRGSLTGEKTGCVPWRAV